MNVLKHLFASVALWLPLMAYTQTVSGTVTDAVTGDPIPQVSVYVPSLHLGVLTDARGQFTISNFLGRFVLIQISSLGYKPLLYEYDFELIKNPTKLNVKLEPSQITIQEIQMIGLQPTVPGHSPHTVNTMSLREMRENGSLSISDGVARLPGMSQLSSGAGISKPVIRGLYGNRVQVNVMGLRFDNQQWQDEHGLGLNDAGIDRVEIIKGATSLLYGSEAIGGVLNVIEEKPAPVDSTVQDINLKMLSNTRGTALDYGMRKSNADRWWRLRASVESNGDYQSAGNTRVLNSRFANYNLKFSRGIIKAHRMNTLNAYLSLGQFGFVFDSLSRKELDGRYSRSFDGPHHTVMFGLVSTENSYFKGKNEFRLNAGWIVNHRQEQEGGAKVSLDMLLNTGTATGQMQRWLGRFWHWTNGVSLLAQHNYNIGSRTIIPDALLFEGGAYTMLDRGWKRMRIESGLRYDRRQIATFQTGIINGPGADVQPFNIGRNALNGSLGFTYSPFGHLQLHGHASTGYRSANLAELSSNGLHEGTSRWEIGNPDLKTEQNLCAELGLNYALKDQAGIGVAAFWNGFRNYIYLAPTGTEYFGFNIYRYVQSDAALYGAEATVDVHPTALKWLNLNANFTHLRAQKADGSYLPFIPANKLNVDLAWKANVGSKSLMRYVKVGCNYVFAQDRPAEFERTTPAYLLFNAGAGGHVLFGKRDLQIGLVCNNLLDTKYVDHLSRYRYYGIYNMGRNVVLNLNLPF